MKNTDLNKLMQHRHGGNGWAVVEQYPQEYCRVVNVGIKGVGSQFYLAWQKLLNPEKRFSDSKDANSPLVEVELEGKELEIVDDIRAKLKSGQYKIENTRMVSA